LRWRTIYRYTPVTLTTLHTCRLSVSSCELS